MAILNPEDKKKQVHMLLTAQELFDTSLIDLKYDRGYLIIQSKENPNDLTIISESQLEARRLMHESKKQHKEEYKEPIKVIPQETMMDSEALGYSNGTNVVYSPQKVNNDAARLNMPEEDLLQSVIAHEKTHISDHKNGAFEEVNISPEYLKKLDMCTEINATISQAALALEKFKETQNIKEMDILWHCGNIDEIKGYVQEHYQDKDCKQKLGALIFQGWLEQNNHVGMAYHKQAEESTFDGVRSFTMAGAVVDNKFSQEEYHKRADKMFKNTALGDIRGLIDVDFKLDSENDEENVKMSELFLKGITNPAKNVYDATKRVGVLFEEVKKADEDGIRTQEEQERINRKTADLLAEKTGRKHVANMLPSRKNNGTILSARISDGYER